MILWINNNKAFHEKVEKKDNAGFCQRLLESEVIMMHSDDVWTIMDQKLSI